MNVKTIAHVFAIFVGNTGIVIYSYRSWVSRFYGYRTTLI